MRVKSQIGLAVGPADGKRWGQVLVQPGGYGIVEIFDEYGGAQQKGVRVLSQLGEGLAGEPAGLRAIERIADGISDPAIVSLILLVPVGRIVYLVLRGEGLVYIKRGDELAKLIHQDGGLSGEIRKGDTLLLASKGFARALPASEIVKLFDHLTAQEVAEKLTMLLHERQGGEGSVALVYTVEQFEEIDSPPPSEPEVAPAETPRQAAARSPIPLRRVVSKVKHHIQTFVGDMVHIRERPERIPKVAAVISTLVFLVSVGLGIVRQMNTQTNTEVQNALTEARHAFEEGVALLELNPVKGRERLGAARDALAPFIETINDRTRQGRDVITLYQQINDNLTQAMQIVEAPPVLFFDMSLVKQGAVASSFALVGDTLAVADQAGQTLYTLDLPTKNAVIVGGGEMMAGVRDVDMHGDKVYALTPEGIVEVRTGDKKSSLIIKRDDAWGEATELVSFGGNLYVLDTGKNRIWKYVAVESGFSPIREYLNPDTFPDFSAATNMTIDSRVWVATKVGKVFRFVQGKEETFVPKGIEPPLEADLLVFTSDEAKNIYLLDRKLSRVVVLDPDGTYLAQYRWSSEFAVQQFAVSEKEKKILLLSGGKVYALEMK